LETRTPRRPNSQELEHRRNGAGVIRGQFFIFNQKRLDADPVKKTGPNEFLATRVFEAVRNQVGVELRFAGSGITFLDFPKSGLRGTGFRDGLAHLVVPNDLNKW